MLSAEKSISANKGEVLPVNMVTDVYSHILDEDRKKNARLFEEAFYEKKNLNPQMHETPEGKMLSVPDGVDAELLTKVLSNPGDGGAADIAGKKHELNCSHEIHIAEGNDL